MGIKNVGDSVAVHRYFLRPKGFARNSFISISPHTFAVSKKDSQMEQILKWNMGVQNTEEKV